MQTVNFKHTTNERLNAWKQGKCIVEGFFKLKETEKIEDETGEVTESVFIEYYKLNTQDIPYEILSDKNTDAALKYLIKYKYIQLNSKIKVAQVKYTEQINEEPSEFMKYSKYTELKQELNRKVDLYQTLEELNLKGVSLFSQRIEQSENLMYA